MPALGVVVIGIGVGVLVVVVVVVVIAIFIVAVTMVMVVVVLDVADGIVVVAALPKLSFSFLCCRVADIVVVS